MSRAPIGQRWHWSDLLILLAMIGAALVLLHVIAGHAHPDRSIRDPRLHPVSCVQHPASDGRGLPACDAPVLLVSGNPRGMFNPAAHLDTARVIGQ